MELSRDYCLILERFNNYSKPYFMDFTLHTKDFSHQQFKAFYCHHFVSNSSENGTEIKFTVEKGKIDSFVSCLIMQHLKFDALHQNLALLNTKTSLQLHAIDEYQRVKLMIKQLLDCVQLNPDLTIEDLNA